MREARKDEIQAYVYEHYIQPAQKRGQTSVRVKSGDVHNRMGLKHRMPAVCNALRKLDESGYCDRVKERRRPGVKKDSSTNVFNLILKECAEVEEEVKELPRKKNANAWKKNKRKASLLHEGTIERRKE